jgi:tetratricopeptide (TPR) repeat protein
LKPDFAIGHRDLGHALDRQGLEREAMEAYQRAVILAPKLADAHGRLGAFYWEKGQIGDAIASFDHAAAAAPDTTAGRLSRARTLFLQGDPREAEIWLRKTVALDRTSGEAHTALAALLASLGRFDEAIEQYEAALRLEPSSFGHWHGIARARRFTEADRSSIERLHAVLARKGLPDEERMVLHFVLGKAHGDLREYGPAMGHFDAGNSIRERSLRSDRAKFAASLDRQIERFTSELFEQLAEFGTADETPLLIVGMPRSGTTLVEQIVSSHPAIAAGQELSFWASRGGGLECVDGPGFTLDAARSLAAAYLATLRKIGPSATRVTDKLPFNYLRLGLIRVLLPNARIIHCRRHPVDTCLSIYSTLFRPRMDFISSKADLVFSYRQYARLMDHWRTVLPPDRFLEVEYERLIADRETETRRLIAFAGLDWDEACLKPERNERVVMTASAWQARQPVYSTSVGRWRNYEPWLSELRELVAEAA